MLTNKQGLPKTFVTALDRDFHKGADYSASQIMKPAQMVHLENRHKSEVVEDVTDRIWSLFGTAVHNILEGGETHNQLVEQYFKENIDGVEFSGMSDLYEDGIIYDYKVTSVWSVVFIQDKMEDFISQLNTYGWLFRKAGFDITGLKIVMILRDWQASKAKFDQDYPQCQVQVIDIPLKTEAEQLTHIKTRINYYEAYKDTPDDELPECSDSDRWAKPPKFAVMKKGRKSALRVLATEEEAEAWMESEGKGEFLEERKGEMYKRCEYCSVSNFCRQYNGRVE